MAVGYAFSIGPVSAVAEGFQPGMAAVAQGNPVAGLEWLSVGAFNGNIACYP